VSGFGQFAVHDPAAGTWTLEFDSRAAADGFKGTVKFEARAAAYSTVGTVTPAALTLQPGQTGTLAVAVRTPTAPGDLNAAVQLDTAGHQRVAVPLTLRSLIPIGNGYGTFAGTLAGGDGRADAPAQTSTFKFDVPAGVHDLGLNVTIADDPNQVVFAYLESPEGQLLSQQTNIVSADQDGNPVFGRTIQGFRRDPTPGRWTLVLTVYNPMAGTGTAQRFTGEVRFNVVDATATGLPTDPRTVLPAGKPVTAKVRVRNTGIAPSTFFVDARSTATGEVRLAADAGETGVALPQEDPLRYVVPPETTSVTARATGNQPIDLNLFTVTETPSVSGRSDASYTATASVAAGAVQPGPWRARADQVGPFGAGGPAPGQVDFSASAMTQRFDDTVTSSTGNTWLRAVRARPGPFTPLALPPGEAGTITVTITPTAAKGTVVTGVLYVDDFSEFAETGDELNAIPYSYTVG
jgi:hypothetical protein